MIDKIATIAYTINGEQLRRVNGRLHGANSPAVIHNNGDWFWYLNGVWHRYYGPQNFTNAWWIHHTRIKL